MSTREEHLAVVEHLGIDTGSAEPRERPAEEASWHHPQLVFENLQDSVVANLQSTPKTSHSKARPEQSPR